MTLHHRSVPYRTYRDDLLTAVYRGTRESFERGERGWIRGASSMRHGLWIRGASSMRHGLWTDDGRRFRGAGGHSAFWCGFDGLTLNGSKGRGSLMYVPSSVTRACYMAGRDCAREAGLR